MVLKRDYKQTDLGVIPEDWDIISIDDIGQVIDGDRGSNYPNQSELLTNGYCLFLSAKNVTSEGFRFNDCTFISQEKDGKLGKGRLKRRDFVLTTRGTIGNFAYFDDLVPFDHIRINSGMVILRIVDERVNKNLLFHYFNSEIVKRQIQKVVFGSAQPQLTVPIVKNLMFLLPKNQDEQHAIAAALSDVDALLASLDALIAKKRLIQQGAMQELLTGRRRLPGFSGEWEVIKLGQVADIKTGKKNNEDKVEDGKYPFFVRSQNVERINSYSFDGEAILIPGEGGIGSIFHYINGKFDYHQRVYKISNFNDAINGKFIYYTLLQSFNKHAMRNTVKATVDSLRLPTFLEFELTVPSYKEQFAIAAILSDMDADIHALEQQRDKTRQIKQGMMQELLTGRIRLNQD